MLTNCAKNWTAWSRSCSNRSQRDYKLTFTIKGPVYRGTRLHRSLRLCMAYGWRNFEN